MCKSIDTLHYISLPVAGEYALAGLFGAVPLNAKNAKGQPLKLHDTNSPATWNSMSQVFPAEGFPVLFDQYKASFLQGGAHIFNATYQVSTLCQMLQCFTKLQAC